MCGLCEELCDDYDWCVWLYRVMFWDCDWLGLGNDWLCLGYVWVMFGLRLSCVSGYDWLWLDSVWVILGHVSGHLLGLCVRYVWIMCWICLGLCVVCVWLMVGL